MLVLNLLCVFVCSVVDSILFVLFVCGGMMVYFSWFGAWGFVFGYCVLLGWMYCVDWCGCVGFAGLGVSCRL